MDMIAGAMALTTLLGGTAAAIVVPSMASCATVNEMKGAEPVTVTRCTDGNETTRPLRLTHTPARGTGGLILRNENGTNLGSGIGPSQRFDFIACGPKGSGLIHVNQIDRNTTGGWGPLYAGYVKKQYTSDPSSYPCN